MFSERVCRCWQAQLAPKTEHSFTQREGDSVGPVRSRPGLLWHTRPGTGFGAMQTSHRAELTRSQMVKRADTGERRERGEERGAGVALHDMNREERRGEVL